MKTRTIVRAISLCLLAGGVYLLLEGVQWGGPAILLGLLLL